MNTDTDQPDTIHQDTIRASDAERERYAAIIGAATGDGRLTTVEAEERLTGIYAARFRHELDPFIADLPDAVQGKAPVDAPANGSPLSWRSGPLAIHLAVVVGIATLLMVRWIAMGAGFFWPIVPMLWLGASLLIHARLRRSRAGWRWPGRPSAN
jgi:hypothetical protein